MDKIAEIINNALADYKEAPDGELTPSKGEFIRQVLEENNYIIQPCPTPGVIEKSLCSVYNMTFDQIKSRRRFPELVEPRQVGMMFNFLQKHVTKLSYQDIARKYGYLDHMGPWYATKQILTLLRQPCEKSLRERVMKMSQMTGIVINDL
jgi:chromosomal replication initiation ATPase DnaA